MEQKRFLTAEEVFQQFGVDQATLEKLVESGAITNARKGIDVGVSVTGGLFGSRALLDHADNNPAIQMRSTEYTHSPLVMAQLHAAGIALVNYIG